MKLSSAMLGVFISFIVSPPAWAKDCVGDASICTGDTIYYDTGAGLQLGQVQSPLPVDMSGSFQVNGASVPYYDAASIARTTCTVDNHNHTLCPGDGVKVAKKEGIVLGVFPTGVAVVALPKQPVQELSSSDMIYFSPDCYEAKALANVIQGVGAIQNEIQIQAPQFCVLPLNHLKAAPVANPAPAPSVGPPAETCTEQAGPAMSQPSPNLAHFQQLLQQGQNAPLSDFLVLWYPQNTGNGLDSPLFACENQPEGYLMTPVNGPLGQQTTPQCTPDVIYSWDHWAVVQDMQTRLPDGQTWKGNPVSGQAASGTLFASLSPSATFGCGTTLIRVKLKPTTPFVSSGFGTQTGMVGVRQDGAYNDITVSDASLIQSWSYGTPEIYDEIVRDVLRYQSGGRVFAYNEMMYTIGVNQGGGIQRLYQQASDGHAMDEPTLKTNLLNLIRQILSGEGGVFYAGGTCRNRDLNFSTNDPSFIDPLPASALNLPAH